MNIDQHLIRELFGKKDRKRRRILFDLYGDYFVSGLSSVFIADMINKDLGAADLVSIADIKYCRFYFQRKLKKSPVKIRSPVRIQTEEKKELQQISTSIKWSDPDEMDLDHGHNINSKFTKK
jgi:hypothetical protein